jgi:hypothetical protein
MANVDRKWLPPAFIALAIAASLIVFPTLPPLVGSIFDDLFPAGVLPPSPPMARAVVAFGIPVLAFIVWTAFRILRMPAAQPLGRKMFRNAPAAVTSAEQFERFSKSYEAIVLGVVLLLVGLHAAVLSAALQHSAMAARILAVSLGLSLVVMGNVMPRLRPNWVAGLRTRRTLADPQLWRSAHRAFGTALVASGLLTVAVAVAAPRYGFVIGLGVLVVSLLVGAVATSRR